MLETLRMKATVTILLACWYAWAYAIYNDFVTKAWLWLAISLIQPPIGIVRGFWILLV